MERSSGVFLHGGDVVESAIAFLAAAILAAARARGLIFTV
jgi:hypothetical protein